MQKKVVIDGGVLIQADGGFYAAQYFCWVRVAKKTKNLNEGDLIFRFETSETVIEVVEPVNNHTREGRLGTIQSQYVKGMKIFNNESRGRDNHSQAKKK